MKNLESFAKKHASLFDDAEPPAGHLERFQQRLDRMPVAPKRTMQGRWWLQIAAGITVLAALTVILFTVVPFPSRNAMASHQSVSGLPDDLAAIVLHYQQLSAAGMLELQQVAESCPGTAPLVHRTEQELAHLDQNLHSLVDLVRLQPDNQDVQTALILQCKAKETILNDALLQGKLQRCPEK